jgi:ABC-type Zn uptake system ZnuABC Zn-binding protein ZnuA
VTALPHRRDPARSRRLLPLVLAGALALASCGGDDGDAAAGEDGVADDRLQVATTVAPITSIAANIGGDRVAITGIVPEGTNSHTFEPEPSVAELLGAVDVVYLNGLVLEEPTKELAEANMRDGAEIVELGTLAIDEEEYLYDFSFPESEGKPNPHLWTDPTYAKEYAEIIAADLSERDPDGAEVYAANLAAFSGIVDELDAAMRESFATIPEGQRKLLTYHDAYAYFAQTYGWEVIGAIQVSDFEDPTPREVAELIEQVRAAGVPAIFGSEVFPSPVLEQIGSEAGVEYVDVLRDDDLPGEPGDDEHSWLGLMVFDYITMTEALGGDASALRELDVRNAVPDEARYPQ